MKKDKNVPEAVEVTPAVEVVPAVTEPEPEVKAHRGREASNVLSFRKFQLAVTNGNILPGMVRVDEVMEGARIKTHAGWKAVTLDIGVDTVIVREVNTIGRFMRPNVVGTKEYTLAEVLAKLA